MCFIFVTPIAALFGWFVMVRIFTPSQHIFEMKKLIIDLQTSLGAYQYYDHKEKLEAFRRSRPLPSLNVR